MRQNVSNKCRDRLQLIRNADNYFLRLKPSSIYLQFIPHPTNTPQITDHLPQIAALLSTLRNIYRLLQTNRSLSTERRIFRYDTLKQWVEPTVHVWCQTEVLCWSCQRLQGPHVTFRRVRVTIISMQKQ